MTNVTVNDKTIDSSNIIQLLVVGDTNADTIQFNIPIIYQDLDLCTAIWNIKYYNASHNGNVELLTSTIVDDTIQLQWKPKEYATSVKGELIIQLIGTLSDGTIWHTNTSSIFVKPSLDTMDGDNFSLSVLDEYLNLYNEKISEINDIKDAVELIETNLNDNINQLDNDIDSKIDKSSIEDSLLSVDATRVLSANQGNILKALIDGNTEAISSLNSGIGETLNSIMSSVFSRIASVETGLNTRIDDVNNTAGENSAKIQAIIDKLGIDLD